MNRRRFIRFCLPVSLGATVFAIANPSLAAAPEPTYTVTLPDKQVVSLRLESIKTPDGRRKVRVWNQPKSAAKSDLYLDTTMTLEMGVKPLSSRVFMGINPDLGMYLEATRNANGFVVREPALTGDLQFGAPLFTPLLAELFIGKMYDFKRGGTQTFAQLFDSFISTAKIATLTLTAEGEPETITLPDGPVKARKLRYQMSEPALPEALRTGVFYVGSKGEVLKCDTSFFGVPLRAKGPARLENDGRRFVLRFKNPDSQNLIVVLQGDKQASGDWKITLGLDGRTEPLATLECDSSYRLKRMQTPWHGRPFTASVVGTGTLRWSLAGGPEQQTPVPAESPVWFLPHWFVTDIWEGAGGALANLAVDETRDGFMLPLFLGQRDAVRFTLKRLGNKVTNGIPVRHYRLSGGMTQAAPTLTPGGPPKPAVPVFDLYTDGSRLAALISNENMRIVRSGWETFGATLTPPTDVVEQTPSAKPPPPDDF